VKDANGCIFSTAASISSSNGPTGITVTPGNSTCGANNGTITLGSVSGGTSPYTDSVDGGAYTSTVVYSNLGAGPHAITVKDANGCTVSTTATISNTSGPTAISVTPGNASCGANNGTLTVGAVTGGTSPYAYSVDAGAYTATLVY